MATFNLLSEQVSTCFKRWHWRDGVMLGFFHIFVFLSKSAETFGVFWHLSRQIRQILDTSPSLGYEQVPPPPLPFLHTHRIMFSSAEGAGSWVVVKGVSPW
ncbi:hypothetical protein J6590_001108 [Homalodisca vitripennis]|nr:hypothetical protein J6590_001108 [Homalodisca vitripennis]